jgi:hypothetical protein
VLIADGPSGISGPAPVLARMRPGFPAGAALGNLRQLPARRFIDGARSTRSDHSSERRIPISCLRTAGCGAAVSRGRVFAVFRKVPPHRVAGVVSGLLTGRDHVYAFLEGSSLAAGRRVLTPAALMKIYGFELWSQAFDASEVCKCEGIRHRVLGISAPAASAGCAPCGLQRYCILGE